ncbi:MAG: VWA domain-containing protein [Filimonas sp.]|nr:VWA domain-containing protein [Filimonas sp.]
MKALLYAMSIIMVQLAVSCGNQMPNAAKQDTTKSLLREQQSESLRGNTEEYAHIEENRFLSVSDQPLSTFSIDVDRAAYSNVRRFIEDGTLPPAGAVRIEEMVNYFDYTYPQPTGNDPFSVNTEVGDCPWNTRHKLIHIGLQGRNIPVGNLPDANLVFLVDVSGSMEAENKLPLVKTSLKLLLKQLRDNDRVAIVTYAGNAGLVLPSTKATEKRKIENAIDNLEAGGSTAGGEGILLAYKVARANFLKNGNNRIILATDGDFNVGVSSESDLVQLVEHERESGVYLTVLGYGMGNYKDNKMQQLADKGNGNHAYIDNESEANKVLVKEFGGSLFTIAKDVKIQVEFNPAIVKSYRLIGYENRLLGNEDFKDDKKDAGELGSGHTVTALYEIIPAGIHDEFDRDTDSLKYQVKHTANNVATATNEIMTVKLRYKQPGGDKSKEIVHIISNDVLDLNKTSENFRFSAAVAEFGFLLVDSRYKKDASYTQLLSLAKDAKGKDENGYRDEFISIVKKASTLSRNKEL